MIYFKNQTLNFSSINICLYEQLSFLTTKQPFLKSQSPFEFVFSSCELLKVICSQKAGVKFPY